jgi:predicted O-methyltransferase YrrM
MTHREENKRFLYIPQELLNNAKIFSDRFDVLPIIPDSGKYLELGVGGGDYTKHLLDNKNFDRSDLMDFYNEPCARYQRWTAENHEKNIKTIKGNIKETILNLEDKYNYIYIDAEHDYDSVYFYLEQASRLLADEGVIGINDYTFWGWFEQEEYTCVEAVNQFLNNNKDWQVLALSLGYCNYSDIYISRVMV